MTLPDRSLPAGDDRAGRAPPLTERRLGPDDLARVVALHAAAHRAAPVPGLFVRETEAFFAAHLGPAGLMLGLETPDRRLAGYCVLGLPAAEAEENFGHALGLSAADRGRVCQLDGTAVLPAWRGHGLQRRLTRRRLALAQAAGRDIALSTAALGNVWSLANLTAEGLEVVALVEKYDTLRLMLRADGRADGGAGARADGGAGARPEAPGQAVPLEGDPARHRQALAAGWRGVRVVQAAGVPALLYLPPFAGRAGDGPPP